MGERVAYVERIETGAVGESPVAQRGDGVGNGQRGERRAALESNAGNGGH